VIGKKWTGSAPFIFFAAPYGAMPVNDGRNREVVYPRTLNDGSGRLARSSQTMARKANFPRDLRPSSRSNQGSPAGSPFLFTLSIVACTISSPKACWANTRPMPICSSGLRKRSNKQ
jgi:hypothetical protein